jgi:hypothetical protein
MVDELEEKDSTPAKTRLVCIAENMSETVPGASTFPEIQIVVVPFERDPPPGPP